MGAQTILNLRVILLSGIWDEVYSAALEQRTPMELRPYQKKACRKEKVAA